MLAARSVLPRIPFKALGKKQEQSFTSRMVKLRKKRVKVEKSSTIPLSEVSQVANISFADHGELNSRARCPPRKRSSARLSCLEKEDLKSGSTHCQTFDEEEIQDHYLFNPLLDSNLTMQSTWDTTTNMFSSAANMLSPSEFVWERDSNLELESFQDLSKYCERSSVEPDTLKLATSGSGNMSVSQDDELNTPVIEIQEAFFGGSTRLIPVPLDDCDGWPVTVNTRPGTFDLSIAEVAQEQQLQSDVISPESTSVNLYSPIDQEKRTIDDVVKEQLKYEEDLNIVVEREETVEMFPIDEVADLYSDGVKLEQNNTGLHLSLPSEPLKISEFASTPDVMKQLENPQAFDLINFIVKDTVNTEAVEPTIDFSAVQFFPSAQQDVLDANETEGPNVGLSPRECSNEQERSPFVEQPEQEILEMKPSASYSVLSRVEDNSGAPLRITIKRESERTRRSSRNKQTTSYADLVKEDDSDEDEESPSPVKRKRHSTPSCSSDGDAPCARYRELRDRNNEASRRSRQTRKAREQEMQVQAETLEKENRELKVKCDELERQLATFRQLLVDILSSKKSSNSGNKQ